MSTALNRLRYDNCAYSTDLSQSVAPIDYVLNPIKYEHCGKCRAELGLVGGPAVSHISGALVDLENDLLNITRPATRCPAVKHRPTAPGETIDYPVDPTGAGHAPQRPVHTALVPLRPCQMVSYPEVPFPPSTRPFTCS